MSLKMKCYSKCNVTQIRMSLKIKCHFTWNVTLIDMSPIILRMECTQNGMSLKMECHSKWYGTQNGTSLKMECHSKQSVTKKGMTLKMECHSKYCGYTQPFSEKFLVRFCFNYSSTNCESSVENIRWIHCNAPFNQHNFWPAAIFLAN